MKVAVADIVNNSNIKSTSFAYEDMQFLDERLERMQTFKDKLYSQGDDGLVKQTVIQKIAESGISYQDLSVLYAGRTQSMKIDDRKSNRSIDANRCMLVNWHRLVSANR